MAGLLANFRNTLIVSVILALVMVGAYTQGPQGTDAAFWQAVFRWLHTFFGILWIGLLYYFNFVQIRKMPEIPAELKPAVSKYIAPEALFWFRWAAVVTVVMGVFVAYARGADYAHEALTFGLFGGYGVGDNRYALLGVGMWLGIIMMLNVWGIIWPNQKRALGIVEADADTKAKAARMAMLGSRTNLLLSIPMLTSMTMTQTLFG
ncbi:urate hydroxylase PuuD [uncultured Phenylobacterium sp.]|uniref:urate hydroxylase PuuD n=1 Tax=uncultured Phenylobacterium sp. TaxID=349273 RepID=UPI0025D71DDB|nr:urate hydroxylase PuuD [uncultured Phenylobacterium sp.]